jgi:hypothetical protein
MEMDLLGAMIAGLVGTAAMTLMIYVGPLLEMPKMDLIELLGSTFSGNKTLATILGTVLHLILGAIFGIIYGLVWSFGVFSPNWFTGLLFGLVHGVAASSVIPRWLQAHPRPPGMERSMLWVIIFWLVHAVFGLATALTYAAVV